MSKDKINFEQSLSELESISKKLESDDITLDEALELFEKGLKLSKECSDLLSAAKQKIENISGSECLADD